jgi:hypothetical protein
MNFPKTVGFCTRVISAASLTVLLGAGAAQAGDFSLESVGARWGLSSSKKGTQMMETDAFVDFNLPWRWDMGKDWHLQTKLNTSIGWFSGGGDQAAIGSVGPAVQLFPPHTIPLSLEGGVSPTLMSRDIFGPQDMGTLFQFTSYLGINLDITKHIRLGYRFQHISNAGLSSHNPGINMNMIALSYVF